MRISIAFLKKNYLLIIILFVGQVVWSCKGTEGPAGPAGAKGDTGAAGAQGPAGNANVRQITYGTKTHTGNDLFLAFPSTFTADAIDKSLVYVYVKQNGTSTSGQATAYWFSVPGETVTGNEYSFYAAASSTASPGIFLRRVINYVSGNETFDAVRVLVMEASSTVTGRMAQDVDFSDYESVKEYYNLPE